MSRIRLDKDATEQLALPKLEISQGTRAFLQGIMIVAGGVIFVGIFNSTNNSWLESEDKPSHIKVNETELPGWYALISVAVFCMVMLGVLRMLLKLYENIGSRESE